MITTEKCRKAAINTNEARNRAESVNALQHRLARETGILPASSISARINELNELEITINDEVYNNVRLVRCFPLTHEEDYIALLAGDGEEIGILSDLGECRPEVQKVLRRFLDSTYLVPEITKVNSVTWRGYLPVWDVETDRGHRVIELNTRRACYMLGNKVIIKDADGNRYEIKDYTALDLHSRRLVEREV